MANITSLILSRNKIGDPGMSALSGACASGALDKLQRLFLGRNKSGDAGMSALAGACASGALDKLTVQPRASGKDESEVPRVVLSKSTGARPVVVLTVAVPA
mgnify:CR=1 FL=1